MTSTSTTPRRGGGIRRTLGRFEITCLGINAIVGAGIFALPDDLFRHVGGASPLVFVICALGLLPIAACYAEAARTTERSGGPYVYVREAFGPLSGHVVGWMCFVNSVFSFAAVAHIAAAYVGRIFLGAAGLGVVTERLIAVSIVLVFCALNALGAKPGARVAAAFTIAKLAALAALVLAALPSFSSTRLSVAPLTGSGLQPAIFLALFAVQGFEVTPVPAGETKEARSVMPFAILASLIGASIVFVVVQAAVVGSYAGLAQPSNTPLADAAATIGPRIGAIVVWGGVVSTLGFVAGNAFGTPRYAFAMAEDGYLPRALAYVGGRGAPLGAIAATGLIAAVLAASVAGDALFALSNLAVAVQYLGTCLAIGKRALVDRTATRGRRVLRGSIALSGALVSGWIMTQGGPGERQAALLAIGIGVLVGLRARFSESRAARSKRGSDR